MSQNFYGNNGELFNVNVKMRDFLERITFCLWDRVGIPRPLSKEDAFLVSRVLNNYIKLQEVTSGTNTYGKYFWSKYGFEQDDAEELELVRETIKFFKRSNGLMIERDWSDKFESDKLICNKCGEKMHQEERGDWYCWHCGNNNYEP